ncbi:MAG TPA: ABC transporter substrate-binding protein [Halanaerobiales bacterium]|nr:ABC transporter substrate-binding protein [Halanaerobiales bacterium]
MVDRFENNKKQEYNENSNNILKRVMIMQIKNENQFLIIGFLVLALFMVPMIANNNVQAEATKIKIQTPPIPAALPLLWIEETGQMEDLVDLDINLSPDHQRALTLINKNQIDMMMTGVNVGAKAYNKGMNLEMLNVNTWAIDYLLTNNFKAENWNDLKGKTLSLPLKGGPLDFLARYFLNKNGLDPEKDVNIVYRPLPNGARYFMTGKVDSILLPEPLVTVNLLKNENAVLSMDIQKEWAKYNDGDQRIPFVGLFVSKEFAQNNPQKTRVLNGLYIKGLEWVNSNPEKAAELGAKNFNLPKPVLQKSFTRINLNYYSDRETKKLTENYFSQILEMYPELLGGKMPDENFYN